MGKTVNSMAALVLLLVLLVSACSSLMFLSAPKPDGRAVSTESGGMIGRGLNIDVGGTRLETAATLDLDYDYYSPNDYDVVLTNDTLPLNYYPYGHEDNVYGDTIQMLVGRNWTFNFSAVDQSATLNLITNITVEYGNDSSESFDALPPPIRAAAPYAPLAYEFTANYSKNGSYVIQAWLWHVDGSTDVPLQWTYATWNVIVYDLVLIGPIDDQSGAAIPVTQFMDPVGIPTAARAHALTDDANQVWHHSYAGSPIGPVGETEKRAYEPAEINALSFVSTNQLSFTNIQDPTGTGDAYYYVFAMYSPNAYLMVWADEDYRSDVSDTNLTDYDFGGGMIVGPSLTMTQVAEPAIWNNTLAFDDDFSAASFDIDLNLVEYSPQYRTLLDLWGAYHQISGCEWGDGELAAGEVAGIIQIIDEEFVEMAFDIDMPSTSAGNFMVDGKVYTYVVDSVAGVTMTGYGLYSSLENLTLDTTSAWTAPSTLSKTRVSHTITFGVMEDTDVWNRTSTLTVTDLWELGFGVPLSTFTMPDYYYESDTLVFIDGEADGGNVQIAANLLGAVDDGEDGEDGEDDEDGEDGDDDEDDDNGTTPPSPPDEDDAWYEQAWDWVVDHWLELTFGTVAGVAFIVAIVVLARKGKK